MKKIFKIEWNTSSIASLIFFIVLFVYPLFSSGFSILNLTSFMYQMLLASSLVLIWGYCGLFSFAQAAFFGLGGYCYGILTLNWQNNALTPIAMLLSVAFGFAVAGIFGYFLFYGKVNDSFLGVITLCFTLIGETFLQQTADPKWKIGKVALNGFNGINKIPPLTIGSYQVVGVPFYYVVLLTILIVLIVFKRLEKRNAGYALFALRENTHRSSLLGYNASKIKTLVFAAGGGIAALAGVYYTMWGGYIVPTSMNMTSATRNNINVKLDVTIPEVLTISSLSLSIILGNTFDNAIEACCSLPAEQRTIHLQLRKQYRSLFYRLENPYSDTSRGIRIGEHHGYGLKNINRIVQENHGDFYTKKKDGVFTVQVRLNCEN